MQFIHKIKLGDWVKALIHVITFGFGERISSWIAVDILGYQSCGCCERHQWLQRLTNKDFNGHCNDVKLF